MGLKLLLLFLWCPAMLFSYHYSYYPDCNNCPKYLGKFGAVVKNAMATFESASYDFCPLYPSKEKNCYEVVNSVNSFIQTITRELLPSRAEEDDRNLSCSHILNMCCDLSSDNSYLGLNQWSCKSCEKFFKIFLEVFKEPLTLINTNAPTFFCGNTNEECRAEFEEVVNIGDILGKLLKGKKQISTVCKTVMQCEGEFSPDPMNN